MFAPKEIVAGEGAPRNSATAARDSSRAWSVSRLVMNVPVRIGVTGGIVTCDGVDDAPGNLRSGRAIEKRDRDAVEKALQRGKIGPAGREVDEARQSWAMEGCWRSGILEEYRQRPAGSQVDLCHRALRGQLFPPHIVSSWERVTYPLDLPIQVDRGMSKMALSRPKTVLANDACDQHSVQPLPCLPGRSRHRPVGDRRVFIHPLRIGHQRRELVSPASLGSLCDLTHPGHTGRCPGCARLDSCRRSPDQNRSEGNAPLAQRSPQAAWRASPPTASSKSGRTGLRRTKLYVYHVRAGALTDSVLRDTGPAAYVIYRLSRRSLRSRGNEARRSDPPDQRPEFCVDH